MSGVNAGIVAGRVIPGTASTLSVTAGTRNRWEALDDERGVVGVSPPACSKFDV
jgi:hypothetical protein